MTGLIIFLLVQEVAREQPAAPSQIEDPLVQNDDVVRLEFNDQTQDFIRSLVLLAIPDEFTNDKKWGSTRRVQSGLKVRFEDGRLRTKRRWKHVKHGRWQKYRARLLDPHARFGLLVSNVVKPKDGPYSFDISATARLRVQARWQDWRLGVPVLRLSTEADLDIRFDAHCTLGLEFDYGQFPPTVELQPHVARANVRIGRFRVKRLGHIKGRVADELASAMKDVVRGELARRRKELPARINKQIVKRRNRLTISVSEWLEFSKQKPAPVGESSAGVSAPKLPSTSSAAERRR